MANCRICHASPLRTVIEWNICDGSAVVRYRLALGIASSHVSIPSNQNTSITKHGKMRREIYSGKVQPYEPYYEVSFVFIRLPKIRILPPKQEKRSCVLIGVGGMWLSDWPERVWAVAVSARNHR